MSEHVLESLTNPERLRIYNQLMAGCTHLWSKGKMQHEKVIPLLQQFIELGYQDPYFLGHLTAYIHKNSESKDLKVVTTYSNALNSADGLPFSPRSKYFKPNLRYISYAVLQDLDPKQVLRVREMAGLKFEVPNRLRLGSHKPNGLVNSMRKYISFREKNSWMLDGIRKAGMRNIMMDLYRMTHTAPSDEAAAILKWKQKDGRNIELQRSVFDFSGLTVRQVATKIVTEKLSVLGCIGALNNITPTIALALLEVATGNEALILRKTFEDQGVFDNKQVLEAYEEKIKTARVSIDRAANLTKTASEDVKKAINRAKAEVHKAQAGDIGKVYMHIDISGSMSRAIEFAKRHGSLIAECVQNPHDNFKWGVFNDRGRVLPLPQEFVEDAFHAVLYGLHDSGSTDVFALYPQARQFGSNVDVILTDQGHNCGDLGDKIHRYHVEHAAAVKPQCCVIVDFSPTGLRGVVAQAYADNEIPVAILNPTALTTSALIAEAVKTAVKGPVAKIEEIMGTELPKLPEWYYAL